MYKLIVTDIDGTLLSDDKVLEKRTSKALENAMNKGIKVVLATGRYFAGIKTHILNPARYSDYIIACNGAYIWDCKEGKEIYSKPIDKEICRELSGKYNKECCEIRILSVDKAYEYNYGANYNEDNIEWDRIYKIEFIIKDYSRVNQVLEEINSMNENISACIMNDSKYRYNWVEIVPKGIDKWVGLNKILEKYKISASEVVAFGDNYTDIPIIKNSGKGIAVGNAIDVLKQAADEVIGTNNDISVAKWLEENI